MFSFRQQQIRYDDMNEIFPNVFVGNHRAADAFGSQFDMVVNCTPNLPFADRKVSDPGICVRISIDDHPSRNAEMFMVAANAGVLEKMHEIRTANPKHKILVHCMAGMQRSCAIVAFYIMKYFGLSLPDAMRCIQQNRPIAFQPQATFLPALQEFERRQSEQRWKSM